MPSAVTAMVTAAAIGRHRIRALGGFFFFKKKNAEIQELLQL